MLALEFRTFLMYGKAKVWKRLWFMVEEQFGEGVPDRTTLILPLIKKEPDISGKSQAKSHAKKADEMKERAASILDILRTEPTAKAPKMASILGITERQVRTVLDQILDGEIVTAKIAQLAVTEGKIANLAITTAKIAEAAITSAKIANAAVDTAQIALGAITTALIAQGAVGTAQIADASITSANRSPGAVSRCDATQLPEQITVST